jgi:aspartate-semialdehyde dehydrogenase
MVRLLEERNYPVGELVLLSTQRSAGRRVPFRGGSLEVREARPDSFEGVDLALFSAGAAASREWAPLARAAGATVIDNSQAFRGDDDVPLVVPEVNPEALDQARGLIANPNCSTIQLVLALAPLHRAWGLERVIVSTYQSVSGTGADALDELEGQVRADADGRPSEARIYPHPIAFNVLPHVDDAMDGGACREEMKMVWETRKIMEDETIRVNPTAVRVPVFIGHSEAVHLETRRKLTAAEARALLEKAPGVKVLDEPRAGGYPTAATEAANRDTVYVGRIREDISSERGLNLWIVADNMRKGAATNSVQIAEILVREHI